MATIARLNARDFLNNTYKGAKGASAALRAKPRDVPLTIVADAIDALSDDILFFMRNYAKKQKMKRNIVKFNHCVCKLKPGVSGLIIQQWGLDKKQLPLLSSGYVSSRMRFLLQKNIKAGRPENVEFEQKFIQGLKKILPDEMNECKLENSLNDFKWNAVNKRMTENTYKGNHEHLDKAKDEYFLLQNKLLDVSRNADRKN